MMKLHVDDRKVLIYARRGSDLLVCLEPDCPAVELQVPGGTVEAHETVDEAACREFEEETGFAISAPLLPIGERDHVYDHDGTTVRHERHGFAFDVDPCAAWPENWMHREGQPSQGEPQLFRFFWMDVALARRRLGYGMASFLDHPFFTRS